MKILHLCFDGNFIENSMSVFEHFYPEENIWIITESKDSNKRIVKKEGTNIHWVNAWKDKSFLQTIVDTLRNEDVSNIVCHGLSIYYTDTIKILKSNGKVKVYWIFWGYELYRPLGYSGKKHLIDDEHFWNPLVYFQPTRQAKFIRFILLRRENPEKRLLDFLKYTDYFCFWMNEDYQLLQRYYPCQARFKHFQYSALWRSNVVNKISSEYSECYFNKQTHTIMVNHQASITGNHITVFKKLKSLKGIKDYEITVPLSYGSSIIRGYVCRKGKQYFGNRFHPVTEYMPKNEYHDLIGKIEVAIFGQLRQEAAGNIIFLLTNGAKVFMREDNSLYRYYKKLGYIIFSIEHDLNDINDLKGLSLKEKRHNVEVRKTNRKCYEDFMPTFFSQE